MAVDCEYNRIQYGNVIISEFVKSRTESTFAKSDDGIMSTGTRTTYEFEFIITKETVHVLVDPEDEESEKMSVDQYMDYIKSVLKKPFLRFIASKRGFGNETVDTNNIPNTPGMDYKDRPSVYKGPYPDVLTWEPIVGKNAVLCRWRVVVGYPDLDSGVTLTANYVINPLNKDSPLFAYRETIVGMAEEQDLSIDENGALTYTLVGRIDFNGTLYETIGDNINDNDRTLDDDRRLGPVREVMRNLVKSVQTNAPDGFHRTMRYSFNKDHRTVNYTVTDTEIPDDNPLFPFTIKADVNQAITSSVFGDAWEGGGFCTWSSTITGNFVVKPNSWKGWAYVAFLSYVFNRRDRLLDAETVALLDTSPGSRNMGFANNFQVLTELQINEHLTGREVSFTMIYMISTDIESFLDNTGLFRPIDHAWTRNADNAVLTHGDMPPTPRLGNGFTPLGINQQWKLWAASINDIRGPGGYRDVPLPKFGLLFNPRYAANSDNQSNFPALRNQKYTDPAPIPERYYPLERASAAVPMQEFIGEATKAVTTNSAPRDAAQNVFGDSEVELPDPPEEPGEFDRPEYDYFMNAPAHATWLAYQVEFELIEDTNADYIPSIEPLANLNHLVSTASDSENAAQDQVGFRINGKSNPDFEDADYARHRVHAFGKPVYYVRMTGYAIRAKYRIPAPTLEGIYSIDDDDFESEPEVKPVYRIGQNRWKHTRLNSSQVVPIHMATWDVTYAIPFDPNSTNINFMGNRHI